MDAILVSEKQKNDWEEFIQQCPYAIAWQSYDWSALLRRHYNIRFHPLAAYDQGSICGILPLYEMKGFLGKRKLISVPFAVAGGIASNSEEASKLLLEKSFEIANKLNSPNITFKHYKVPANGSLKTDDKFFNRELRLSNGLEKIWNGLDKVNQSRIEASRKLRLTVEFPSEDLDDFYRLLFRHHHNTGMPCVSRRWIKDLIDFGMYSIALERSGSTVVAGTLVKAFKDTVSFPLSCIPDLTERSLIAAYGLYWSLMERFSGEGKEIFHSGRIPDDEKVIPFRLGWGGTQFKYFYQYYPYVQSNTEHSTKRGLKRSILESCWKKAPSLVARSIGPVIVKQFP